MHICGTRGRWVNIFITRNEILIWSSFLSNQIYIEMCMVLHICHRQNYCNQEVEIEYNLKEFSQIESISWNKCLLNWSTAPNLGTGWHHKIDTFSTLLALWEWNPPVTGGFHWQWASDAELWCFLWSQPVQSVEQTIERQVNQDVLVVIWRGCNESPFD